MRIEYARIAFVHPPVRTDYTVWRYAQINLPLTITCSQAQVKHARERA